MKARFLASVAVAVCAVATVVPAQAAAAQQQQQQQAFSIPAGDLKSVLDAYARQSGRQLIYRADQARGVQSPGVSGSMSADEALTSLLAGTGLTTRKDVSGALAIVSAEGNAPNAVAGIDQADGAQTGDISADDQAIVVTGTRIAGAPPIAPTIVATRKDIEDSGRTSLPDYIATIPQVYLSNNGASPLSILGGFTDSSFSSSISLRGLGADSTLTLLNGRRMAPAAGVVRGSITDISGIPIGAIERIEIVPDGSSAIYGSDAMGGVVNIILRKQFKGIEVSGAYGFATRGEPINKRGSVVGGHSWGTGSVLAAYEHLEFGNLLTSDRSFTSTRDLRPRGGSDFRSTSAAPGTVTAVDGNLNRVQQALGLTTPVPFGALPAGDGRNLSPAAVTPGVRNLTDVHPHSSIFPGDKRDSAWVSFEQQLFSNLNFFATGLYSRRNIQFTQDPASATLTVPASNAFNPFGETVTVAYLFQEELGPQVLDRKLTAYVLNAGFHGQLGENWSWELATGYAKSRFKGEQSFALDVPARTAALADSNPATALNPFGDGTGQNMATFRQIVRPTQADGAATVQSYSAILNGKLPWLSFGANPAKLALGAEHRKEGQTFATKQTTSNAPPPLSFGQDGRKVYAAFAEVLLPFFGPQNRGTAVHDLEVSVAGRFERYNDFGDSFNPRAAIRWRPIRAITLRAAASRSFKAPNLEQLSQPFSTSCCFTVIDPKRGGERVSTSITSSGNPDLGPETSTSRTVGVLVAPQISQSNFSAELNYFHIKVKDRVTAISTFDQLVAFEDALPPGLVIRNASGVLTGFVFKPFNSAVDISEGLDAAIRGGVETGWGRFGLDLNGTYHLKLERQLVKGGVLTDNSRNTGFPSKWRTRLGLSWSKGPASLSAAVNHAPGATNILFRLPDGSFQKTDSFTTVDMTGSLRFGENYSRWFRGLRISASVLNLLDKDPPFVNSFTPYDSTRADPRGRFINLSLSKAF